MIIVCQVSRAMLAQSAPFRVQVGRGAGSLLLAALELVAYVYFDVAARFPDSVHLLKVDL